MRTVSTWVHGQLLLLSFCILLSGCHSRPGRSEPTIEFTKVPAVHVGGPDRLDTIEGRATGSRAGQQIVLYAKSDGLWWVQPFTASPFTNIQADSRWKGWTHFGTNYAALLVEPGYAPPDTTEALPSLGEGLVAVAITKATVPVWETSWFQLSIVALVGFLVLVVFRLRDLREVRQMNVRFEERLAERTRMARELHDTFLQTLQGSKLVADDALENSSDPVHMRRAMEQLSAWLERAIHEGRAALNSLRTSTTETNDLAEALKRATEESCMQSQMQVSFSVTGSSKEIHPMVRDEIYRIGYEAIRNAYTHSNGNRLEVSLLYGRDLAVRVSDNGIGINPTVADQGKNGHFGLHGMRERAARIGGKLTVVSMPNSGTEVTIVVPGGFVFAKSRITLLKKMNNAFRRMGRTFHAD